MKNFIKIFIVLIFSLSQLSFGQFNKAGRTAMQFLKIGNGSRQVAMGEAAIAGVQDVNSIFWNPAAITGIQNADPMQCCRLNYRTNQEHDEEFLSGPRQDCKYGWLLFRVIS